MRVLFCTVLGIGTILAAVPIQAQTYDPSYPFCMKSYSLGGGYIDCSYMSLAQCNATASGRAAQCFANPFFVPPYAGPPDRAYRRHSRMPG